MERSRWGSSTYTDVFCYAIEVHHTVVRSYTQAQVLITVHVHIGVTIRKVTDHTRAVKAIVGEGDKHRRRRTSHGIAQGHLSVGGVRTSLEGHQCTKRVVAL